MSSEQQRTSISPTHYSQWFILVTAVFVTCLVTANITAVKLVGVFGLVLPAAIIIFPISYIFGDVVSSFSVALPAVDHQRDRCHYVSGCIPQKQCLARAASSTLFWPSRGPENGADLRGPLHRAR